jgi:hypothetical protein
VQGRSGSNTCPKNVQILIHMSFEGLNLNVSSN